MRAFCEPVGIKVVEVAQDSSTGALNQSELKNKLTPQTAGVYVEYPSFLGFVEQSCSELARLAHDRGALFVVGCEPISLGTLKAPGEFGADIMVGEGQPLGSHMNYGGPLLGIFACRGDSLLRQMPGRIIGKTTTKDGTQDAVLHGFADARATYSKREGYVEYLHKRSTPCLGCSNVPLPPRP